MSGCQSLPEIGWGAAEINEHIVTSRSVAKLVRQNREKRNCNSRSTEMASDRFLAFHFNEDAILTAFLPVLVLVPMGGDMILLYGC